MENAELLGEVMKAPRIFLFIVFLLLLLPAPSRALNLGGYTGQVVDRQTGRPIAGASVLCYWTKRVPVMWTSASDLIAVKLVYTDSKGQYTIPRVTANMGLTSVLEKTVVVIYEPGYQAYIQRIDSDSPKSKKDRSFHEKNNLVKLDRIPPYFSHRGHYQRIREAMDGLEVDETVRAMESEEKIPWAKILEMQLKFIPEREEFLRRVEWEDRRPAEER
jgi:hypothetical protein